MKRHQIVVSHDNRGQVWIELEGKEISLSSTDAFWLSKRLEEEAKDAEMEL